MKTREEILEIFVNICEEIRHGRAIVGVCEECSKGTTQGQHERVHLIRAGLYLEDLPEYLTWKDKWETIKKPFTIKTEHRIVFP